MVTIIASGGDICTSPTEMIEWLHFVSPNTGIFAFPLCLQCIKISELLSKMLYSSKTVCSSPTEMMIETRIMMASLRVSSHWHFYT